LNFEKANDIHCIDPITYEIEVPKSRGSKSVVSANKEKILREAEFFQYP
jgi:hypothetical protein